MIMELFSKFYLRIGVLVAILGILVCNPAIAKNCNGSIHFFYLGPNSTADYIEVSEITFDLGDIVDDFDLIGCPSGVQVNGYDVGELDKNQDGISDWIFSERQGDLLIWKPENGYVTITEKSSGDNAFNPNLGYGLVCVKRKPWLTEGSGIISAKIMSKLPDGEDSNYTRILTPSFSGCSSQRTIQNNANPAKLTNEQKTKYTLIVNSYKANSNIVLTDTLAKGTNGGSLRLIPDSIKVQVCPPNASCNIMSITDETLQVSFSNFISGDSAAIIYERQANSSGIPGGQTSKFTNIVTLSTGESSEFSIDVESLNSEVISTQNDVYQKRRVALVIGNNRYEDAPLYNPVNDAQDMANVLISLGFQVIMKTDLNQEKMEEAINQFSNQIQQGDVALFYFSGHGSQVDGENYLIPIDENIQTASDLRYKAVNAGFILGKMEESENRTNIILLDACRNNPFKGFKSPNMGFAPMIAPRGTFIGYATAPGSVAWEGGKTERNSIYTKHLLEAIALKGQLIEQVFKQVIKNVEDETNKQQTPWVSFSAREDFYFNP